MSAEIGVPYTDLDAIDLALRTGKSLKVYQRTYQLARMKLMVDDIARQAVAAMMRRIGAAYSVQNVILVGGGAFLFRKAVHQAFASHRVLEIREPMFANVRGYQIAGLNYAATALQGTDYPGEATDGGDA